MTSTRFVDHAGAFQPAALADIVREHASAQPASARAGEAAVPSVEEVIAQFGAAIWRVTAAYAIGRADREDLYQEIVTAIWRALPRFRGDSAISTYVMRIANNRGLSHRAQVSRAGSMERDEDETIPDPAPGPDERLNQSEARRRLELAVRQLTPALAQPVMLHLEGMTYGEIATVLGITENNVGVRMNRARAALARHLNDSAER